MPKSARPRAGLPIIVLCFCGAVLLLLPGLAFAAALMQPDMLLVAHGSSGAVPAVCLHQGSVGFSRGSYSILHPGTNDSAYQLLAHLDQMGCQEIDCIFVPALAAPMRSLEVYLKRKPVKSCMLLGKASSEKRLQDTTAGLLFAGVNTQHLGKMQRQQWSETSHPWQIEWQRLENADLKQTFKMNAKPWKVELLNQKNGAFVLKYASENGTCLEKQFPRSNHAQIWKHKLK